MSEIIDATIAPVMPEIRLDILEPVVIQGQVQPAVAVGGVAASTFTWTQSSALATWTVPHNLNRYPSVTVVDGTGAVVETGVRYVDQNIIQVTADAPFAGKAYIN